MRYSLYTYIIVFGSFLTIFYESVYHLVCETGSYQTNEYSLCSVWFDYSTSSGDGNTRMSLTTDSQTWMATNYPALDATSTNMCTLYAPMTLSPVSSILIEVKKVCQQICNICPDTTSVSPTTSTTTLTNTRKSTTKEIWS